MPNLDDVTGRLARLPQLLRSRPRDTRDGLASYRGVSRASLFPEPGEVPAVQTRARWKLPGLTSEDLVFRSLHEPLEPEFANYYHRRRRRIHTVYARRIVPAGVSNRPRLIYVHGYMQPETLIEEVAIVGRMARRLDVEVIQIQPPYHGRRKPRRSPYDGELYWTADLVRSFEAIRQTLLDVRTLRAILAEQRQGPIGVTGLSLGGSISAMLTCLEPRFDFTAPMIAHMDMAALLRDAPVLAPMRNDLARVGWDHRDWGAFFTEIGWDALRAAVPADHIMLIAASQDHFFDAKILQQMWRSWGEPEIHWYPNSHMSFLPSLFDAVDHLRRFIDRLYPR